MYKPKDFKKGCPVCNAITKSKTKKNCDFCKAELLEFKEGFTTSSCGFANCFEWKWFLKPKKLNI